MSDLTERQRTCLEGFIARKTAKQLARELGITHHTVERHLKEARKKLGARNSAEAARRFATWKYTTVEPHYGQTDLHETPEIDAGRGPPGAPLRLRDVATNLKGADQQLSVIQTLTAIAVCALGLITILALIVSIADGIGQLTS